MRGAKQGKGDNADSMNNRIYLSPPCLTGKEYGYVESALDSNWVAPAGPGLDAFEEEMCCYTGARHAVALSSGTAALHLALLSIGLKQGDKVLCSNFTFAGTAFPILYCGGVPVFVDSELTSWNMDPNLLEEAIEAETAAGAKPKACIVVHLYGQTADMAPIVEICNRFGIFLIEDAAEAIGAKYGDYHAGTIGPIGVFSFNGNKIITTSGGGMLVSAQKEIVDKARYLSTQARDAVSHYQHSSIGYNYRMSNVLASIGRAQLEVIEARVQQKREIFKSYQDKLAHLKCLDFMPEAHWGRCNRWLTCLVLDPKCRLGPDQLRRKLEEENIETRLLWKPMALQPVFKGFPAYLNGTSEQLFENGLCLPSGPGMSNGVIDWIAERIVALLG